MSKSGARGQKIQRPEITSRAGSSVIITSRPTPMPMAATGPRPAVEFMSAKTRHSMPSDDGERAGDDGRRRAVQGEGHRLVPVLVTAQLFSIARHEQQRVVGAGAEHEHREDALALRR